MTPEELYKLRFPIGEFDMPSHVSTELKERWIQSIHSFPFTLGALVQDLSSEEKKLTYRPEGWNIKQVVHHCTDSHMNSLIRFKLTLTEDAPTIRPYYEDRWAMLSDGQDDDLSDSLDLLTALHSKWVKLLNGLTDEDLHLTYVHPEHGQSFTLLEAIGTYAWHCDHHLGHVRLAIDSTK